MLDKREKYEILISRLDEHIEAGHHFEAAWYASGVIEDRLISLLRQSGGATSANGNQIRTIGAKIKEVKRRLPHHTELAQVLPVDTTDSRNNPSSTLIERLNDWKNLRNELMHELGDSTISIADIDTRAPTLSSEGRAMARKLSAAVYRLKKLVR